MALSHVHRGTLFERHSLHVLQTSLSMALVRVGGSGDGGVDLQGWWWLPEGLTRHALGAEPQRYPASPNSGGEAERTRIRVLAQCKLETRKLSPKNVRELEGVLMRYREYIYASRGDLSPLPFSGLRRLVQPVAPSNSDVESTTTSLSGEEQLDRVVGLLISAAPFTKGTILRAHSSPVPLMLLHLPAPPEIVYSPASPSSASSPIPSSSPDPEPDADAEAGPGEDSALDGAGTPAMGSFLFNPALGGTHGLLRGQIEPRWEYASPSALARLASAVLGSSDPSGSAASSSVALASTFTSSGLGVTALGRPGLWCEGRRVQSCVPEDAHAQLFGDIEEEGVVLQDEDYISETGDAVEEKKAAQGADKKRKGRARKKTEGTVTVPETAADERGVEVAVKKLKGRARKKANEGTVSETATIEKGEVEVVVRKRRGRPAKKATDAAENVEGANTEGVAQEGTDDSVGEVKLKRTRRSKKVDTSPMAA
ncbi:hypothetical protein OBBRIDRAFT_374616 [Obba rivulosa]|uniref:Uncharacterized protein n=1 Tax=Obba rivulosa TaxID=1052685 RepID=A0A8E2DGH4_9APHY|nr:hypothetical protein OBBRIDRAFT_374616 [Obba rivulosa]